MAECAVCRTILDPEEVGFDYWYCYVCKREYLCGNVNAELLIESKKRKLFNDAMEKFDKGFPI